MTTKTDITLPPLPTFEQAESACEKGEDGPLERFIYENEPADTEATVDRWRESIRSVMYAAVEAGRQGRMPSDDDIAAACKSLGWDLDAQEEADMILLVRTVLARPTSGLPAASAEPRPDEYDYFVDWYDKDAPDESEVGNFDMARHAWLAGVRFADLFPVAAPVAQEPVARDWPSIQSAIDEYLDGYELIGEPDDHTPTEFEKFLLADAIAGLLDDEKFLGLFAAPVAAQAQDERWKQSAARDPLAYAAGYSDGTKNALDITAQAQPCDHVYEARPIDGSRRASAPFEAVCQKCGYRPAARAAKGQ